MPSEPIPKGQTQRVVIDIKGPLSEDKLKAFRAELKALARTVKGTITETRRRPRSR